MSVGDIVKLKTNFTIKNILNDRILLSNSNNINNEIVNIDGKLSILDYPFNHQLTFIESKNDYILEIMDLPEDMIIEVALNYDSNNINQLCLVNKDFNNLICNNEPFWKRKFIKDYNFIPKEITSWKKTYNTFGLYGMGYNDQYNLGLGDVKKQNISTKIDDLNPVKISSGKDHVLVLDIVGNVWSFGSNNYHQLGFYGKTTIPTIIKDDLGNPIKARDIAGGFNHSLIIDIENNIWSFGDNEYGQLGHGGGFPKSGPYIIPNIKAKKISAGASHSLIIDMDNNVWSFGDNSDGELGLGDDISRNTPTMIKYNIPFKVKDISAGYDHSLFIDMNDNVWSCGNNEYGQCGLGINISSTSQLTIVNDINGNPLKAKYINAGYYQSYFIDINDNVLECGNNEDDKLGFGDNRNRYYPDKLTDIKAKQIVSSDRFSLLRDLYDNIFVFGDNYFGQLGLPDIRFVEKFTKLKGYKVYDISVEEASSFFIGYKL